MAETGVNDMVTGPYTVLGTYSSYRHHSNSLCPSDAMWQQAA